MSYIPTYAATENPGWTGRNKKIAGFIKEHSNVLDLGCGSKDLLQYINAPKKYTGIDYNNPVADLSINFNESFTIPKFNWTYIVCSGLIEYLYDIDKFFKTIQNNSEVYIITLWKKFNASWSIDNPYTKELSVLDVENKITNNFTIVKRSSYKKHNIYICRDKI